ncbi:cupin domain-containing protein [Pseudoalteromonas denitrificans]|uniref:Cupin superfamily n=1 Tax=Pseudoalteromonas denitrificans DSM 6059 TaxID=1123010 RepID=A0A1I1J141_9GAMM|nr:cupin domain-containing protein [Pseudoalteromonas denitrificans]SFC42224.1 Cupin superfamily [Pseudoalteromonas denitrificans DSM 6059]
MDANKNIHPDVAAMIDHYKFDQLPVEGTFYKSTYRSSLKLNSGQPAGTAMIGMYSNLPLSVSCFHKLKSDEVWHVYPSYFKMQNSAFHKDLISRHNFAEMVLPF